MASESAPETKRLVAEVDALAQCLQVRIYLYSYCYNSIVVQQIVLSTAKLIQFHGTVKKLYVDFIHRYSAHSL